MPNYCDNVLILRDADLALKLFLDQTTTKDSILDFRKILPTPEGEDWYEHNCKCWGTKWYPVVEESDIEKEKMPDGRMEYRIQFDTAWTPPIPAIHEMLRRQPLIYAELNWVEQEMDFSGWMVWKKGEVVEEFNGDSTTDGYRDWLHEKFGYDTCDENAVDFDQMLTRFVDYLRQVDHEDFKNFMLDQESANPYDMRNMYRFEEAMQSVMPRLTKVFTEVLNESK